MGGGLFQWSKIGNSGEEGGLREIPSVVGVWIFPGTTHLINSKFNTLKQLDKVSESTEQISVRCKLDVSETTNIPKFRFFVIDHSHGF